MTLEFCRYCPSCELEYPDVLRRDSNGILQFVRVPAITLRSIASTAYNETCTFCLVDFKLSDRVVLLQPCNHLFCESCIVKYYARTNMR